MRAVLVALATSVVALLRSRASLHLEILALRHQLAVLQGNSEEEAIYPTYYVDADGNKLDGPRHYTLHFAPDKLPPANSFWSLTMYDLPDGLLVANPIDRYLLNSPMLPDFVRDDDGGITLYIQHNSPGKDKEPNWLPAPEGTFYVIMRLYWPKAEALDGTWRLPPLTRVGN